MIFEQIKETLIRAIDDCAEPKLSVLNEALTSIRLDNADVQKIRDAIPIHPLFPYSRKVLCSDTSFEVMIARWSPGLSCLPHDHGDSYSAILVLDGCSEHKRYRIHEQSLCCVHTEYKNVGEIISCGPHQIHSMTASPQLLTLHLYMNSISDMLVYDTIHHESYLVDGGSGAWIPRESPSLILGTQRGYVERSSIQKVPL